MFISDMSNSTSFEDIVELLVPALQKRGLMWGDHPGPWGTCRENLLNAPGKPFVAKNHPAKTKFDRQNFPL